MVLPLLCRNSEENQRFIEDVFFFLENSRRVSDFVKKTSSCGTSHFLITEDHFDELFVIDVSRRVLLTVDQGFDILLAHLFPQRRQHVT